MSALGQTVAVILMAGLFGWAWGQVIINKICRRLRAAADQYEIGDPVQRACPGNAWVLRMIAFAIDGKDQPL